MRIGRSYYLIAFALTLALAASCAPEENASAPVGDAASQTAAAENPASAEAKKAVVLAAFDAYNARDADGILALVSEDVSWPDGRTSDPNKRLSGHPELRKYWRDQWEVTRTVDTPIEAIELPDGRIKVRLDQIVKTVAGEEVSRGTYEYFFTIRDGLITRLDIKE